MAISLELNQENMLLVCAWCGYEINERGIRKKRYFDKYERESCSNGICLVCSMEYFREN